MQAKLLTQVVIRTPKASGWRPFILPNPVERFYSHVMMVCSAERGKSLFEIAVQLAAPIEWVTEAVEFWMNVGMLVEQRVVLPSLTDTSHLRAFHVAFPTRPSFWSQVRQFLAGLCYG